MISLPTHLTKINVWGMPYHGLVADGRMALPDTTLADLAGDADFQLASDRSIDDAGETKDGIAVIVKAFPGIGLRYSIEYPLYDAGNKQSGTSRLWQNPSNPVVSRTIDEANLDAERGHQWKNYALFAGGYAQFARNTFTRLGYRSWVYLSSDGSRWQIQITIVDLGANPIQVQYKFRKFGEIREGLAESFSAASGLISIANPGPPISSARIAGVADTGEKALFVTHEYNSWVISSAPVDHFLFNYGPMSWVYELSVTDVLSGSDVVGVSLAATVLKSRTDLIKGLETVTADTYGSIGNIDGATSSVLLTRAFKKTWWLDAYYADSGIEYVKLTVSDSVTGSASSVYTRDDSVIVPPCFIGVYTSWNIQDHRSYVIQANFEVGADSYLYSSEHHINRSEIVTAGVDHKVVGSSDVEHIWRSKLPFASDSEHIVSNSSGVDQMFCIGGIVPSPPLSVSAIPSDINYTALVFYKSPPPPNTTVDSSDRIHPCWFINGEGLGGLFDLYFDATWRYQYRLFNDHGTPHTLADAEVVIDTGQPLEYRIPLYGSAHPVTHDYIYAQATPVCYA